MLGEAWVDREHRRLPGRVEAIMRREVLLGAVIGACIGMWVLMAGCEAGEDRKVSGPGQELDVSDSREDGDISKDQSKARGVESWGLDDFLRECAEEDLLEVARQIFMEKLGYDPLTVDRSSERYQKWEKSLQQKVEKARFPFESLGYVKSEFGIETGAVFVGGHYLPPPYVLGCKKCYEGNSYTYTEIVNNVVTTLNCKEKPYRIAIQPWEQPIDELNRIAEWAMGIADEVDEETFQREIERRVYEYYPKWRGRKIRANYYYKGYFHLLPVFEVSWNSEKRSSTTVSVCSVSCLRRENVEMRYRLIAEKTNRECESMVLGDEMSLLYGGALEFVSGGSRAGCRDVNMDEVKIVISSHLSVVDKAKYLSEIGFLYRAGIIANMNLQSPVEDGE